MAPQESIDRLPWFVLGIAAAGLVFLLAVGWAHTPSPIAHSGPADCPQTLAERYQSAELILTGRVEAVLPGNANRAQVYIAPDQVYRGKFTRPTVIIDARDDRGGAPSSLPGELHFATGQPPYLLFLHQTSYGWQTRRCDGSRFLGTGLTQAEWEALGLGGPR